MSSLALCGACLTRGRRLSPLGAARAAHITRGAEAKSARLREVGSRLPVCWECRALVDRSLLFCERVHRAQLSLETAADQKQLSSISNLCSTVKLGFDYRFTSRETNPATSEVNTAELGAFEAIFVSSIKNEIQPEEVSEELEKVTQDPHEVYNDPESSLDIAEVKLEPSGLIVVTESKQAITELELPATVERSIDEVTPTSPLMPVQIKTKTSTTKSCLRDVDSEAVTGSFATDSKVLLHVLSESEMKSLREKERSSERYLKSLFKCDTCILGFLNSILLEEHKEKKHKPEIGPHRCDICEMCFPQDSLLVAHRATHFKRHMCVRCGFTGRTHSWVRRHYRNTHETDRVFPCRKCDRIFPKYKDLIKHQRVAHNTKLSAVETTRSRKNGSKAARFQCSLCPKGYSNKNSLRTHVRTHEAAADTPEPQNPETYCVECDRYYKSKVLLKTHLQYSPKHVSRDTFKYACDECGERYHFASALRTHVNATHLKNRTHPCDACDKKYYSTSALQSHVKRCHTAAGERSRDHTCTSCDRSFFDSSQLKAHSRIHTKERPYACLLCPATFGFSAALYTHNKLKHKMTTAQMKKKLGVKKL